MLNKLYSLATEPIYFTIIGFVNFISRHVDLIHEVQFISVWPRDNQHYITELHISNAGVVE